MSRHYLYLTNDKLVALMIKGGTLVGRENFPLTDIESAEFDDYVRRHARTPTSIITDLIEEDFRLDTIPHLRGGDQDAVLERKLGQLYRASPYRHAIIQGREEEGRRDDRVFMHAVANADMLKPVVGVLERHQVPLEAISSSAVLSGRLLKELDIYFPHTMLVTIVPDFGLRQTYFKDKQIKFSRLTPIIYDESRSVGQLIAAETSRTWQYLDSLRYFTESDSLEVCILVHERDRAMLQDAIRTYPMLRYRFLDISEVSARLKVAPSPTSSHAEELLCHVFSRSAGENHFAAPAERRYATFRRARIALFASTAVVLASGAAGAAFNLVQANRISNEIEKRNRTERVLQSEFQSVVNSMRAQKSATDTVRDTAVFFNSQIRPQPATPGALLAEVAGVTDAFPLVRLNQAAWLTSNDPTTTVALNPIANANAGVPGITSSPRAAAPGAAPAVAGATPPGSAAGVSNVLIGVDTDVPLPGNKFHIVVIDAAIQPFNGDYRAALAEIDRYVAALSALPGMTVKVTRQPVDTTTDAVLKALDRSAATATEASFTLHIAKQLADT
jgi:hypothetical protein